MTRAVFALMLGTLILTGCATFKGSRRIDVGPFAENTVSMIGEVQRVSRPPAWIHLKRYQSLPSVQEARAANEPLMALLRGVALYSTQVVSLYEAPLSESRKLAELARYVRESIRPALEGSTEMATGFTTAHLDTIIHDIPTKSSLIEGLGAVQPLVTATMSHANRQLDGLDRAIDVAYGDLSRSIERDFAPLKNQIAVFEELQLQTMRSYTLLNRYRLGDAAAIDSLRAIDPPSAEKLPRRKPTTKDLDAAEQDLLQRLARIESLKDQLVPEFTLYKEHQGELEALRTSAEERARLTRITLILWARSHRNLAAGIGVPPAIDLKGILQGTVSSAAGAIVP